MYQICAIAPIYHFSTDAQIGAKCVWRSHAYITLGLAQKLARIWWDRDYENFGERAFYVVPFNGSPFTDRIVPDVEDEILF